jgi:thiol-disulfide isomerase/thioredoxin
MRVRRLAVAALVGVLMLSGCGGGPGSTKAVSGGDASAASAASADAGASPSASTDATDPGAAGGETANGPAAGQKVNLAFKGKTLDGTPFDGATLAGKPTVLWFWAPWCTACRRQSSDVRTFSQKYAGKVTFVGIAGLDKLPAMRTFVTTMKVGQVTHLADEAGVVWKQFGITQQSTYVLVSADGAVVDSGIYDDEDLGQRLAMLH